MAIVKFGDIVRDVKINVDRANNPYEHYVAGDHMDSEDLTIHRYGSFETDDVGPAFTRIFKPGQILYGSRRTYLKKVAVADFEGICANTTFVLESKDEALFDNRLLPFIMLSDAFTRWSIAHSKGSTNPYVLFSDLADYEFDLPPIAEQKVLADKLWAAYRLKESYKKLLAATEEMVKSQFIEMFGNPVTNPKGWKTSKIKDVAPESPSKESVDGRVWLLNLDMIESNTGKVIEKVYEDSENALSVQPFDEGNVLFSKLRPYLNKVVIPDEPGLATTELVPLRPKGDILNKIFFSHLLRGDQFVNFANDIAGGTKMPRMPLSELRKFECILPPIEEQMKFVAIAELADKSKFVGLKSRFIEMFGSHATIPVGNYIEDSYPGEWGTEDKEGDGVKVIRTTNFTNTGKLDLTDVVTRSIIEKKIERKTIHKYDTILERSGGTADNPVGRVVLFEEDDVYLCNNFTQVLRFKNIDPRFAFYSLFYFYQTNKTAIRAMGSKTTGIQNLNMSKYLEIGIPDATEDEQNKFVSIAEQADKSKYYYQIA